MPRKELLNFLYHKFEIKNMAKKSQELKEKILNNLTE
jgi:hypothetical protein